MTMHLVRGMTSINNRKRRVNKKPGHAEAQAKHDKWLRKMGVHPDQLKGKKKDAGNAIPDYAATKPAIPTSDRICGIAGRKEAQQYTGTLIKGIATMHKSNMVPIISKDDAKEVARMRRG